MQTGERPLPGAAIPAYSASSLPWRALKRKIHIGTISWHLKSDRAVRTGHCCYLRTRETTIRLPTSPMPMYMYMEDTLLAILLCQSQYTVLHVSTLATRLLSCFACIRCLVQTTKQWRYLFERIELGKKLRGETLVIGSIYGPAMSTSLARVLSSARTGSWLLQLCIQRIIAQIHHVNSISWETGRWKNIVSILL